MFLTEEQLESIQRKRRACLLAAGEPDPVSEPEVCPDENMSPIVSTDPDEELFEKFDKSLVAVPKSVETVDPKICTDQTPIGYMLPRIGLDENSDWTPQLVHYSGKIRKMMNKVAKRFIRQIKNSRGYDLDVLPPECMFCPLIPELWFKKSLSMYAKVKNATQFVIKTGLNRDKTHKPYELVDIKKVVSTGGYWHLLLTFTVKEVDTHVGEDDEPFDYGVVDDKIYDDKIDDDLPNPDLVEIDYDNDKDSLFNYISKGDGDGDVDGALKTYQATVGGLVAGFGGRLVVGGTGGGGFGGDSIGLAIGGGSSELRFQGILFQLNMEEVSQSSTVPIYLVTVLDVSYMEGTKIALLKQAMGFLIPNLGPNGRLFVVAFSHNCRRLLPLRRMSESGRADGGTDIAQGLRNGAIEPKVLQTLVMEDRRYKNPVSSIILLYDGQDNNVSMKQPQVSCQWELLEAIQHQVVGERPSRIKEFKGCPVKSLSSMIIKQSLSDVSRPLAIATRAVQINY
ncbi:OLC1v1025842C1 [Oldenlandia corymbosa var. corymbosa]|uniref:OLC1v1025842C1 n=1 Tax=Oldenlandia corymbosa var. corymbosa TaxID=529605 RepID=A0AAV1C5N4_OLDCO|nr:OLC1v1025842C1 [Oldenlandia corymbosa var. corymbosa]